METNELISPSCSLANPFPHGASQQESAALAKLRASIGLRCFAVIDGHPLYRSRQLNDLDAEDIAALRTLSIVDVHDLRKPAERCACEHPSCAESHPFRLHVLNGDLQGDPFRTQAHRAANIAEAYGAPGERMVNLYSVMANNGLLLREVIDAIMHPESPTLIHCVNGKDRTGVVSACVQRQLGYSKAEIAQDYLETNRLNAPMNERDLAALAPRLSSEELSVMAAMFEARTTYLDAFWETIDMIHGSFASFMRARI